MMSSHRSFLRRWLFFCLAGLGLVGSFNILLDPYGIFGTVRISGFNALKPRIGPKVRTSKIHQVLSVRPKAVVIGNSRPEIGLDPEHPCWPKASQPVYNAAIPGMSVYGQIRYGQHAIDPDQVNLVLIGLDFIDFLVAASVDIDPSAWPVSGLEPMPLRIDAHGKARTFFIRDRLQHQFEAAFSLDALSDSIGTLIGQRYGPSTTRTELGFNPGGPIFEPIVQHEGARLLFLQKNRSLAERLTRQRWSLVHGGEDWSSSFEAFSRFLQQSRNAGHRVIPFINPLHADFLTLIDEAGLWPMMEEWKRRIVAIAEAEADVSVWDFSGFDEHSTEQVADLAGKGESLEWFWEPAHYRQTLGDKMLATMLAASCPEDGRFEAFGTDLDELTIDDALVAKRSERDGYRTAHRGHVEGLSALVVEHRRSDASPVVRASNQAKP